MKTILVDAFNTFVIKDEGIFADMYNLLEKYPNNKIILTNANDVQVISLGLVNLPYELFSLKHNPDKTDPVYFEKMLKHFNLKSAESLGIKSYHYDYNLKDLVKLKEFLDNNS